jgi:hypothetical protein
MNHFGASFTSWIESIAVGALIVYFVLVHGVHAAKKLLALGVFLTCDVAAELSSFKQAWDSTRRRDSRHGPGSGKSSGDADANPAAPVVASRSRRVRERLSRSKIKGWLRRARQRRVAPLKRNERSNLNNDNPDFAPRE